MLNTEWFQVGPTKVKARKSILSTEGSLEVEIKHLRNLFIEMKSNSIEMLIRF